MRVGLVEFAERHDTRTNGQHYTVRILASRDDVGVSGVSARMSRGCYEETASVEFMV